jgi:phosphoglucosamine mutase
VAFFTKKFGFDAGVVISASHNPFQDNGVKVFSPTGRKLEDKFEREIEADLLKRPQEKPPADFTIETSVDYNQKYIRYLLTDVAKGLELFGVYLALDCGNGAAANIAPTVFTAMGANVIGVGIEPNGQNINAGCGALYPDVLCQKVVQTGANLGIAFDGDADRAMFVDDQGTVRDGDYVLYILGKYLKSKGTLAGNRIVATVMSNIGLELALKDQGIEMSRAAVGDKYVLEELLKTNGSLGGEQSGHIIFPRLSLAGDGLVTALQVLKVISEEGKSLRELCEGMQKYPQILINVKVSRKLPFDSVPKIKEQADKLDKELKGNGRLLLRYSGTENLARVMIEGKDQKMINAQAESLADLIRAELG